MALARGPRVSLSATDRARRDHAAFRRVWHATLNDPAQNNTEGDHHRAVGFEDWFRDDGWPLLQGASLGVIETHLRSRFLDPLPTYAPAAATTVAPPVTDQQGRTLRFGDLVRSPTTGAVWTVNAVVAVKDAYGRLRLREGEAAMHRVRDATAATRHTSGLWVDEATMRLVGAVVFSEL